MGPFLILIFFSQFAFGTDPFFLLLPNGVEKPNIPDHTQWSTYLGRLIGVVDVDQCNQETKELPVMDLSSLKPLNKRETYSITCSSPNPTEVNEKLKIVNAFEFNTFFHKKSCGKLEKPNGGTWDKELSAENANGTQVGIKCSDGFTLKEDIKTTCENGHWSRLPTCTQNKNPSEPGEPKPKPKEQATAFPIWAIILIPIASLCFILAGLYCAGCICKSEPDDDEFLERTQTMPSMNLHINVDENNLDDEMFNSAQFNMALENMKDFEEMMGDFGDRMDSKSEVEIVSGAGKSLELVETNRNSEQQEELNVGEEKPLRQISSSTMNLSFGEMELEEMMNMEQPQDFASFKKMASGKSESGEQDVIQTKEPDIMETTGTISILLSEDLIEIERMMSEEPMNFDSFKLATSAGSDKINANE